MHCCCVPREYYYCCRHHDTRYQVLVNTAAVPKYIYKWTYCRLVVFFHFSIFPRACMINGLVLISFLFFLYAARTSASASKTKEAPVKEWRVGRHGTKCSWRAAPAVSHRVCLVLLRAKSHTAQGSTAQQYNPRGKEARLFGELRFLTSDNKTIHKAVYMR